MPEITTITRGQALDIASRAALKRWPYNTGYWSWARSQPGRSVPWMVTLGDHFGPLVRVLVAPDGEATVAMVQR